MIRTPENENRIVVGISHGDINSISYEVIIKSCLDQRILELFTPVVYGLSKVASYHRKLLNIPDFSFNVIHRADQANIKRPNLLNMHDKDVKIDLGESTPIAGELALLSLNMAIEDLKKGAIDVLVTAPVNKNNIQSVSNEPFTGHTGYLAQKMGANEPLMLMVSNNLRIGLVTGHIPLSEVTQAISTELILKKIALMEASLIKDFAIRKPRIAILGLNPHAGDQGLLGTQEQDILQPAINKAINSGSLVFGPYPADGFFAAHQYKEFDGVLAMYHDQGLIPFKTLAFENGVNYTAGLPFIRTSPDHGTAYDIAGKDKASADSMRAAIYLACDIFNNRLMWDEITKNPLAIGKMEKEN
ncbi:MAG: 4-hydroxythreonine-4-phosphate dehydrogenase PdxA [Bacteroidales bacterium]|nr:4-hydroxythreonine-4-phosphate dehydrogenase PdxA [Bacteroidales bacterium]